MAKKFLLLTLSLLLGLTLTAQNAEKKVEIEKVIVVFKTHFDIGFTGLESEVVERYRTSMIDSALKTVNKSDKLAQDKQFSWTMPSWPVDRITENWEGQNDQRNGAIQQAIKEGRIKMHALPFTIESEAATPELIARSLEISRRIAKRYGIAPPRAAKMTDVPSHSWTLPTVLKAGGIEFLHLGCNPASQSPKVPLLFNWEGPDGEQLLTMYISGDYGTSVVPPKNWPYKTWLAMIMTGDNHGPPTNSEVKALLRKAKKRLPKGVEVKLGSLEDFSDAIKAENAEIPVIKGDMPDSWIHGVMTSPVETGIYLHGNRNLDSAEKLYALTRVTGNQLEKNSDFKISDLAINNPVIPDAQKNYTTFISRLYEEALRYAEHTWAINTTFMRPRLYGNAWEKAVANGTYKRYQKSWAEKGNYARRLNSGANKIIDKAIFQFEKNEAPLKIALFNPESTPQNSGTTIALPIDSSQYKKLANAYPYEIPSDLSTLTASDLIQVEIKNRKKVFTAYITNRNGGEWLFPYIQIKPLSINLIEITSVKKILRAYDNSLTKMESDKILIEIDKENGGISKILRKSDNQLIFKGNSFGAPLLEKFGTAEVNRYLDSYLKIHPDWAYNDLGKRDMPYAEYKTFSYQTKFIGIRQLKGFSEALFLMELEENSGIMTLTIQVENNGSQINFDWEIQNKKADPMPEAGWLQFPFSAKKWSWKLGRGGSFTDPQKDIVDNSYKDIAGVQEGAEILTPNFNVAIIPRESILVSVGRPGLWRFSKEISMEKPDLFVNLYNNQWGTNYRQWIGGTIHSSVSLFITEPKTSNNSSNRFLSDSASKALINPVIRVLKADSLPSQLKNSLFSISEKSAQLSEVKWIDNKTVEIRIWEKVGEKQNITVTLHPLFNPLRIEACSFAGEKKAILTQDNNKFQWELNPFQPQTFRIYLN